MATQSPGTADSTGVDHGVRGPEDVTAALDLFGRRYQSTAGDDS
jgi:hypothetical protein